MKFGGDFHDLATFYWEGERKRKLSRWRKKASKRARERRDELRSFLAKRARESGDRQAFLNLEFEQAADQLTLQKYKAFAKICKPQEWVQYEPLILKRLDKAWDGEKLKIFTHRKDFDQALAVLKKMGSPGRRYYDRDALKAAQTLEERFPREILAYYRSGLDDLKVNLPRKEYAAKAVFMAKARHVFVDVLKAPMNGRPLLVP
jgi:hypothetical protein